MGMRVNKGYEKAAHLYDLFDTKDNVAFFYQFAKEFKKILDIGAGTGRIAIPLAEKGVEVVCIEPSQAMRKQFYTKLEKSPSIADKITILNADAKSFKLDETFPAAFLSGSFDHLLDDTERIKSLRNIHQHLNSKGKIIFDVFIGLMKNAPLALVDKIMKNKIEYHRYIGTKILPHNQISVLLVYKTYKAGLLVESIKQESLAAVITRNKVIQLLDETKFELVNEYGDYTFSSFNEGDSLLIIKAMKKENSQDY